MFLSDRERWFRVTQATYIRVCFTLTVSLEIVISANGRSQFAGLLKIMSIVGICVPPACADVTKTTGEGGSAAA